MLRRMIIALSVLSVLARAGDITLGAPASIPSASNYQSMALGPDGGIHVCYNGKYRTGAGITALGAEEIVTSDVGTNFSNPMIFVGGDGAPHIVYQKGSAAGATRCFYTQKVNGSWIAPEQFAHTTELSSECERTLMPEVAADAAGNVLVSFYAHHNPAPLQRTVYRWRDPSGVWSGYKGGLTPNEAVPRVKIHDGGFYLHFSRRTLHTSDEKMLTGPVEPLGTFAASETHFNTFHINRSYQGCGSNFCIAANGAIAAVGNYFNNNSNGKFPGIWASDNVSGSFYGEIIAELPAVSSHGDDYGLIKPKITFDNATGDIYFVYNYGPYAGSTRAYYMVKRNGSWSQTPQRLLPEYEGNQGWWQNPPSIADIPGPGVVVSVPNDNTIYLRTLGADGNNAAQTQSRNTGKAGGISITPLPRNRVHIANTSEFGGTVSIHTFNGKCLERIFLPASGKTEWHHTGPNNVLVISFSQNGRESFRKTVTMLSR